MRSVTESLVFVMIVLKSSRYAGLHLPEQLVCSARILWIMDPIGAHTHAWLMIVDARVIHLAVDRIDNKSFLSEVTRATRVKKIEAPRIQKSKKDDCHTR